MANNNLIGSFINKKKAESAFLTIEDGENQAVTVREIKAITKTGFGGEEKEVIRLVVDVMTDVGLKIKNFDNGTQRFAQELADNKIDVGSKFTISRTGQQTKTRYTISNVINPGGTPVAQTTAAPAPVVPASPETPPNQEVPEGKKE